MKVAFLFSLLLLGAADAYAREHGPFPCDGCLLAAPAPDGNPGNSDTTLGALTEYKGIIANSPYGFAIDDAIKLCNAAECVTYVWRGVIGTQNVWNGSGREKQSATPPGGGGGEGSPGPGPGGGFTLVTLCGYVNNILDICLTYVASDPENPGTGGDVQ